MAKKEIKKEVKKVEAIESVEAVKEEVKESAVDLNRQTIIDALSELGVEIDSEKSTQQLTEDLRSHVISLNKKIGAREVDRVMVRVKSLRGVTNLKDEEFLARLVSMGIQDLYLISHDKNGSPFFLFTDEDAKLSDKQIHEKVRFSHINPVDTNSLFTKKIKRPTRYHFGSKYRNGR